MVEAAAEDDKVEELDSSAADPDVREGSVQESGDDDLGSDVQQVKIQRLEAKLESLSNQLEATQDRNERTAEKIGSLRENLKDTQRDIQTAVSSAEKAEELVASVEPNEIDKKISRMKAEVEAVRDGLSETAERREQLRTQIRNVKSDLDEIGSLKQVKHLKEDASEMLKTSQKLSNQAKTNANKVEDLYELLRDKAQTIDELDVGQQELFDKVENHGDRLQSLELESTDVQKQLRKVNNDIDNVKQTFGDPEGLGKIKVVTHDDLQSELEGVTTDFTSKLDGVRDSVLSEEDFAKLQKKIAKVEDKQASTAETIDSAFTNIEDGDKAELATTVDIEARIAGLREDMVAVAEVEEIRTELECVKENQAALKGSLKELDEKTSNVATFAEKVDRLNENVDEIIQTVELHNLSQKVDKDELDQELSELTGRLDTLEEEDLPSKVDEDEFDKNISDLADRLDAFEEAVSQMENSPFAKRRSWARQFEKSVRHIYQKLNTDREGETFETQQLEDEVRQLREQLDAAPTAEEYANYRQQTEQLVDDLSNIFSNLNKNYPDSYPETDTKAESRDEKTDMPTIGADAEEKSRGDESSEGNAATEDVDVEHD